MKFRRGVPMDAHLDDHARRGEGQELYDATPDRPLLEDGQIIIMRGLGKIMWRDGESIYEVTGTLVG